MTAVQQLQSILSECHLEPETLVYLLQQGIDVEHLRLGFQEPINGEDLDSFIKIMQGERFLALLIGAQ